MLERDQNMRLLRRKSTTSTRHVSPINSTNEQLTDIYELLNRNTSWIQAADNKAYILLGIWGFYIAQIFPLTEFAEYTLYFSRLHTYNLSSIVCFLLVAISVMLIVIAPIIMIIALFSKLKTPSFSIHFFGTISKMSLGRFINHYLNLNTSSMIDSLMEQVHSTSSISNKKHIIINYGLTMLLLSIVTMFVAGLMLRSM